MVHHSVYSATLSHSVGCAALIAICTPTGCLPQVPRVDGANTLVSGMMGNRPATIAMSYERVTFNFGFGSYVESTHSIMNEQQEACPVRIPNEQIVCRAAVGQIRSHAVWYRDFQSELDGKCNGVRYVGPAAIMAQVRRHLDEECQCQISLDDLDRFGSIDFDMCN